MKKKLFTLFVMLPFMAVSTCAQLRLKGDINEDSAVDISDVVELVNIILNGSIDSQSYLTCPDSYHPHLIDLGLPSGTKWACCNVDDDHSRLNPTNYGSYYAWGETKEHEDLYYDWRNYLYCNGSSDTCHDLGNDIAGTQYDVAHMKWGGSWMVPSREQQEELISNCTYEWTIMNGKKGGKFTSKINGGSIFLPAAGNRDGTKLHNAESRGCYYSSKQSSPKCYRDFLYINSGSPTIDNCYRSGGLTVRPVIKK